MTRILNKLRYGRIIIIKILMVQQISKFHELLDRYGIPSGEQFIVFQGTDNNETINPNNPFER